MHLWYSLSSKVYDTHIHEETGDSPPQHCYTYMHIYMHTYMHACIHTYIHTYILTYIHTYIHIYIHTHRLNIVGARDEDAREKRFDHWTLRDWPESVVLMIVPHDVPALFRV